jgi:predicted nucleic acid-binding protein
MEIRAGSLIFLDTNILLTATDKSRAYHKQAQYIFNAMFDFGYHLCTSGQVLREYLVVATRPVSSNGLGLETEKALKNLREFSDRMTFFEETEAVNATLLKFSETHALRSSRIHDANIAAIVKTYKASVLITENESDFSSFSEIEVMNIDDFTRSLVR